MVIYMNMCLYLWICVCTYEYMSVPMSLCLYLWVCVCTYECVSVLCILPFCTMYITMNMCLYYICIYVYLCIFWPFSVYYDFFDHSLYIIMLFYVYYHSFENGNRREYVSVPIDDSVSAHVYYTCTYIVYYICTCLHMYYICTYTVHMCTI